MNSPKKQYLVSKTMDVTRGVTTVTDGYVDFSGALYNNGGRNLTPEEYVNHPDTPLYEELQLVGESRFMLIWKDALRRNYTDKPPCLINEDIYYDMWHVMPPLRTGGYRSGVRFFLLSEFTIATITEMFARYQGIYLRKYVDVKDRDTWITLKHFEDIKSLTTA